MLRKLRERMESEKGFTLVELLVVILIIGILAAIAIPSFLSQREKAQDAEAKSAVKTAQTAVESRFTDENTYAATPAQLVAVEATLADVEADLTVNGTATDYTVTVESSTGQTFSIARAAAGTTTRPCTAPGDGGCPTDGTW